MRVHELKLVEPYYTHVKTGLKKFELRNNDRDFRKGDILVLKKYDPKTDHYSGDEVLADVDYILKNGEYFGLKDGFVIMGITVFRVIDANLTFLTEQC